MASPSSLGEGQPSSDNADDDADDDVSSYGNTASTEPSCYTFWCSEQAARQQEKKKEKDQLESHLGFIDYPTASIVVLSEARSGMVCTVPSPPCALASASNDDDDEQVPAEIGQQGTNTQ